MQYNVAKHIIVFMHASIFLILVILQQAGQQFRQIILFCFP